MANLGALRTLSTIASRLSLASQAGLQHGGDRDLYNVFGYKTRIKAEDFLSKYIRQDIASRIVDAPPQATWSPSPKVFIGGNEPEALNEINKRVRLWGALQRADRLSRLNHFSVVLFGFDDGGDLEKPVNPSGVTQLLYMKPIGSRLIDIPEFEENPMDPRFGLPKIYTIKSDDPRNKQIMGDSITSRGTRDLKVHHSRIVHMVEDPLEDEVFGIPIMEKVYNLLDDLLKVSGGTAETYWLMSNRGMQADIDKDMDIDPEDANELAEEIEEYQHQLRRIIKTRGVKLESLGGDTADPTNTFNMLLGLTSGTTGIPKRVFTGSEVGQLASEQDRANWADRIAERRDLYAEPGILVPTIEKLQFVGLLPEGEITVEWPDAFRLSPLERAQTMAQQARAIGNMSRQTGNKTPMQITSRQESRDIIGLDTELSDEDLLFQLEEEDGEERDPEEIAQEEEEAALDGPRSTDTESTGTT